MTILALRWRIERQRGQTLDTMLEELPRACDRGTKCNAQGYKVSWKGYKLHLDTADGGVPVSALLSRASMHDSQAAVPLSRMTAGRVTHLYEVMDAAYCSVSLREDSHNRGHIPRIDHNPRGGEKIEFDPAEAVRYNERTVAERMNARLKDEFGGKNVWAKGHAKVMGHLMFGLLALTADQLMRLCNERNPCKTILCPREKRGLGKASPTLGEIRDSTAVIVEARRAAPKKQPSRSSRPGRICPFGDFCKRLRWLYHYLHDIQLIDITPHRLENITQAKLDDGASTARVNCMLALIRSILRCAANQWTWLDKSPTVRMLAESKRRIRWLTREEAERLLTALPPHLTAMAGFALAAGLRESNIPGLEWSQVDIERRIAWIHPDQAKARKAITVPLNAEAVLILRRQLGQHDRWVFTYQGNRVTRANNHAWRKTLKRAGIEDFKFHDLRHTWASCPSRNAAVRAPGDGWLVIGRNGTPVRPSER
jgi:integrase